MWPDTDEEHMTTKGKLAIITLLITPLNALITDECNSRIRGRRVLFFSRQQLPGAATSFDMITDRDRNIITNQEFKNKIIEPFIILQ